MSFHLLPEPFGGRHILWHCLIFRRRPLQSPLKFWRSSSKALFKTTMSLNTSTRFKTVIWCLGLLNIGQRAIDLLANHETIQNMPSTYSRISVECFVSKLYATFSTTTSLVAILSDTQTGSIRRFPTSVLIFYPVVRQWLVPCKNLTFTRLISRRCQPHVHVKFIRSNCTYF